MLVKVRHTFERWYTSHIRHQVFVIISVLMLLVVLAIGIISWAATEIAADSFINQRATLMQRQWMQSSIQLGAAANITSPYLALYSGDDNTIPDFLKGIDTLGVKEFELSNAHVVTFLSPFKTDWLHFVYFPDKDPEMVNYGQGVMAYVAYMMLLVFALGLVAAHLISRHFSLPILGLVQQVHQLPEDGASIKRRARNDEIGALQNAYQNAYLRIQSFLEREKQFTRFASHELRTPVHVTKGAVDLLKMIEGDEKKKNILSRIELANQDMEKLINTFLLIGREEMGQQNRVSLGEIINESLSRHHYLLSDRHIDVMRTIESDVIVAEDFAKVVLANLVRNAFSYSLSSVRVVLEGRRLVIQNDISEAAQHGFGHGEEIVKVVCRSANWRYHFRIASSKATVVIYF
ncbi:sensor histidine kinase [Enterovibrio norvegicus]|uniref:sensor histidine kinase n=1 Tax=Enterovibrio norvegicus TaxID=188144 RepID=UPI0010BE8FD0|nr:HAMP domain-containing sensor histidine kinase [Enterovibrio norvegicus]TKF33345.1 HAMP domain-containing histidine kinase [Enterovibrio norvegicus]